MMNNYALTSVRPCLDNCPSMRVGVLCVVLCAALAACTKHNPAVCCTSPSDCSSIGATGETERPCTDGFVCLGHECTTPPDAPPGPACTDDSQCSGTLPHCSPANECVECVSSDQCSGLKPVCDASDHACHACSNDDECASSVCDVLTGACIAESEVLYVAPAGAGASDCSRLQPCTFTRSIVVATPTRSTVKMAAGNYDAYIVIAGKDVSIHGQSATLTALANNSALDIQAGAHVRVEGLSIVNQGGDGAVYCSGTPDIPSLDLSQVSVSSDGGTLVTQTCTGMITGGRLLSSSLSVPNVLAAGANFTIERSIIDGGNGVLAEGTGSLVRINNSLIVNQLGTYGPFSGSALFTNGPGSIFVSFSTVIGSVVKCSSATPTCAGGSGAGSCIDNTIVFAPALNPSADVVQGNCTVNYSLVTPQNTPLSGSNNLPGVQPGFTNANGADYHLESSSPAVDAGDPSASNAIDYDGVLRPQGARRDIGAFEYH